MKEFGVTPRSAREVVESVLQDAGERSRLVAYASSRFGIGHEEAEDLLQETALELLRQRTQVSRPGGFVFAVFRSRCCRHVAYRKGEREVFDEAPLEEGEASCETLPLDSRLAVRQAFGGISPDCRRVLLAYYVDGRSLRDAAEAVSRAYSSVWNTISRCLKRLRRCLA